MMDKTRIARKEPFVKKVIFLNGIGRAGKFFLGKIVSGYEQIEYFQYLSLLEHLPYLERLGCITEDAAISLLQTNVDEHAYNTWIGRNLNLRYDDASSIYNSNEAERYLRRPLTPISGEIVKDVAASGRNSLFILHDSLSNVKIFFKAYPKMKWINLDRHPADIIHSWYLRGWGHRFASDPLSFIPLICKGKEGHSAPWYTYEWKEEYEKIPEMDRIIKSITTLLEIEKSAYESLSKNHKKQILFVSYEGLVENTKETIDKIATFLNVQISSRMPLILNRERCPSKISVETRAKKIKYIKKIASKNMFNLMMNFVSKYEKEVKG